jgi:hypothetical protein
VRRYIDVVGEMKKRTFGMQNKAVAGVIEALLMVALVSIVLSVIQLVYVPEIMEQREAEHMELVSNQISALKSMIDLQGMTQSSAPISSMITLGSRDLPYFITAKAWGEVDVKDHAAYKIKLNPALDPPYQLGVPLTSIEYNADNSYFVDQSYILEGGGLIVQQPDGVPVMRSDPSISAVEELNTLNIHFDLPYIIAVPGKNITTGEGNCFIRTNFSNNHTYTNTIPMGGPPGGAYIRFYTAYLSAWNESLHNILGIYEVKNCISIYINSAESCVEIIPVDKDIELELNVVEIYVQIGQGWIL